MPTTPTLRPMPSTTPIDDPASASLRRQAEAVLSAGQQRAAEVEAKVRAGEAPDNATCYRGPGGAAVAVTASEGVTAKFGTGARRSDTVEEFRYDLITPIGLREVARTCAEGAAKYDDYNWEKGMPVNDLLNHALAHVYQFLAGDRSEPHLPHAAWNMLAAIHSDTLWPHLNDGTLRGPGCSPPRRDAQADPAMPSAAESRYAASGKAVEVVRAGEHDAAAIELRKRGYTQSQAEPWKWFAPVNTTPLPPPDLDAIRERARRWSGPFTPTYHMLAADVQVLADLCDRLLRASGEQKASTLE